MERSSSKLCWAYRRPWQVVKCWPSRRINFSLPRRLRLQYCIRDRRLLERWMGGNGKIPVRPEHATVWQHLFVTSRFLSPLRSLLESCFYNKHESVKAWSMKLRRRLPEIQLYKHTMRFRVPSADIKTIITKTKDKVDFPIKKVRPMKLQYHANMFIVPNDLE